MDLQSLPVELLISISTHILSSRDLLSLCQTNRRLHSILINALYRLNIHHYRSSALQWAAIYNRPNLAMDLLSHSADINTTAKPPGKCLPASFVARCCAVFARLVAVEFSGLYYCETYSTPLLYASAAGYTDVVQVLLNHRKYQPRLHSADVPIDLNSWNRTEYTPLSAASIAGYTEVMELLLAHGASASRGNYLDIIHEAAKAGVCGSLRVLVQHGVHVDQKTSYRDSQYNETPLKVAAKYGRADAVKTLLELGADRAHRDTFNPTAYWAAVKKGHASVVEVLLEAGDRIEQRGMDGMTTLEYAVFHGLVEMARFMLERGMDPNERREQESLLCVAIQRGHVEVVRLLLEYGADANTWDTPCKKGSRMSVLAWVVKINHWNEQMAQLLIDYGADVNVESWMPRKPLLTAAVMKCQGGYAKLLVKNGADVNRLDSYGNSPLFAAISRDSEGMARWLLDQGADVNARKKGKTMLSWAKTMEEGYRYQHNLQGLLREYGGQMD